jgi:hypothetical protein
VSTIGATAVGLSLAGCVGLGGEEEETDTPTDTDDPSNTGSEETDTPDMTDTPENNSLFANYGIDGKRLVVELTENALGQVSEIRLETPSEEKTTEVSETITAYSFKILEDRAGTWSIIAIDDNRNIRESVELDTSFEVSIDNLGTLAELGITRESAGLEQVNIQMKIMNSGDVPVEPFRVDLTAPRLNINTAEEETEFELVDEDIDDVIVSGGENTYRSNGDFVDTAPLLFNGSNIPDDIAGESFQGQIDIIYGTRENTAIPVVIELGDTRETLLAAVSFAGTEVNIR